MEDPGLPTRPDSMPHQQPSLLGPSFEGTEEQAGMLLPGTQENLADHSGRSTGSRFPSEVRSGTHLF